MDRQWCVVTRLCLKRCFDFSCFFFTWSYVFDPVNVLVFWGFFFSFVFKKITLYSVSGNYLGLSPCTSQKNGDLRRGGKTASYSIISIFLLNNQDFGKPKEIIRNLMGKVLKPDGWIRWITGQNIKGKKKEVTRFQ